VLAGSKKAKLWEYCARFRCVRLDHLPQMWLTRKRILRAYER